MTEKLVAKSTKTKIKFDYADGVVIVTLIAHNGLRMTYFAETYRAIDEADEQHAEALNDHHAD